MRNDVSFCPHYQRKVATLACLTYQDAFAERGDLRKRCDGCGRLVIRKDSRRDWRRKLKARPATC